MRAGAGPAGSISFEDQAGAIPASGATATAGFEYGTSALVLEGEAGDVLLTASLTVEAGQAAGIGLGVGPDGRGLGVIIDARQGTIGVVEMGLATAGVVWQVLAERRAETLPGRPLPLRVVLARSVVDVFLDDDLMLSVVVEGYRRGRIVLIADDARVRFEGLRVRHATLPEPVGWGSAGGPTT